MSVEFTLTISGRVPRSTRDVGPGTLAVSYLAQVLTPLEEALQATARATGEAGDEPALVLLGHEAGSSCPRLLTPYDAAAAVLTGAMAADDWSAVPIEARRRLSDPWNALVQRHGWTIAIDSEAAAGIHPVRVSPEHLLPAAEEPIVIRERTSVYGTLNELKGRDRTKHGELRTRQGYDIRLVCGQEVADCLKPLLWQPVKLIGVATTELGTGRIRSMEVLEAVPLDPSLRAAVEHLREVIGGAFDDIDPEAWVRRLRDGGPV